MTFHLFIKKQKQKKKQYFFFTIIYFSFKKLVANMSEFDLDSSSKKSGTTSESKIFIKSDNDSDCIAYLKKSPTNNNSNNINNISTKTTLSVTNPMQSTSQTSFNSVQSSNRLASPYQYSDTNLTCSQKSSSNASSSYINAHTDSCTAMSPSQLNASELGGFIESLSIALSNSSPGNSQAQTSVSSLTAQTQLSSNSASSVSKHGHYFSKKTFHKPAYCHQCTELLWGLIGQGFFCEGFFLVLNSNKSSNGGFCF